MRPTLTHLSHMHRHVHTHIHTHTATTNSLCGYSSNSKKKKNAGHYTCKARRKRMPQPERMLLISRICEQQMLRHAKERQKRTTFLVSFLRQPTRNEAFLSFLHYNWSRTHLHVYENQTAPSGIVCPLRSPPKRV